MNKQEILNGIKSINLDCSDFDQNFEGDQHSTSTCKKGVETENYNIEIEFEEIVMWTGYDDYEFEALFLSDVVIIDIHGKDYSDKITDNEILNCINY